MKFKSRNLRAIAECIIGDNKSFKYRSSTYITEFFEECDLPFQHDGSTRWAWTSDRLAELLDESCPPNMLPPRFVHVLRVANSNMRCDSFKSLMIINKLSKFL